MKVYVEDRLWEEYAVWRQEDQIGTAKWVGSAQSLFDEEVSGLLDGGNKHLAKLDNGGFEVVMVGNVTKISKSDISLADTYTDRLDRDKIKEFSPEDVNAQTFAFQEAVFKLPPARKKEVNLRILFMKGKTDRANAEEMCICDQHPIKQYGCVVFSKALQKIPAMSILFAHEIGHTLGYPDHDDKYYNSTWGSPRVLYMWPNVGLVNLFR